nr:DUF1173 domain-containing protein [Erwinia oleae]
MAVKKTFPVRFAGLRGTRECAANFRTEKPEQWQRWLKYARDNKATTVVTCLCRPPDEDARSRRLKVHLSQKTDQCWLASWPFSGHEHAPDCRFYFVWSDERQAAVYAPDAVKAAPDGSIIIHLPTGMLKKDIQEKKPDAIPVYAGPVKRRRQPSMRLLGLLHLLWEQSGINVWHPAFDRKKRYLGWVSWRLNETATRTYRTGADAAVADADGHEGFAAGCAEPSGGKGCRQRVTPSHPDLAAGCLERCGRCAAAVHAVAGAFCRFSRAAAA